MPAAVVTGRIFANISVSFRLGKPRSAALSRFQATPAAVNNYLWERRVDGGGRYGWHTARTAGLWHATILLSAQKPRSGESGAEWRKTGPGS